MKKINSFLLVLGLIFSMGAVFPIWSQTQAEGLARIDLLSFARGAVPVATKDSDAKLKVGFDQALQVIDGNSGGFGLTPKPGGKDAKVVFVYELPAITTFESFAIPNVLETPSAFQTFVKKVEVMGSNISAEGPFVDLGSMALSTHQHKGELSVFAANAVEPVRWVRVVLEGGILVEKEKTFFEFSELIGYGEQELMPLSDRFTGKWKGRGVKLELHQEGVRVSGCYDSDGDLNGTVSGNLLHATGMTRQSNIPSTFVLTVDKDGGVFGVRSTNGAPFRMYSGDTSKGLRTPCSKAAVEPIQCGSIVHGIQFDFDSATIHPVSAKLLDAIYDGLKASTSASISLVGYTSSEGSDAYNKQLSQRRAEAVTAAMIERGIDASRLHAVGRGEQQPIADNRSEAGRALNRRVEIECGF